MVEETAQAIDDRKPKAEAAVAIRLRSRQLNELTEYGPLLVLRDSHSAVADIDAQPGAAAATADHHSTLRRVAHGVGDQVQQDAFEQNKVAANPGAARNDLETQP